MGMKDFRSTLCPSKALYVPVKRNLLGCSAKHMDFVSEY